MTSPLHLLEPEQYLNSVQDSIVQMGALAIDQLHISVTDCPGWTVADLIGHVGKVLAMVDAVVIPRSQQRVGPGSEAIAPPGTAIHEWFEKRSRSVVNTLANVDPHEPLWTWSTKKTASFYFRRMAHETAVHLCDLQRAIGNPITMNREVACDGIDEYFIDLLPFWVPRDGGARPPGSLHLHSNDGPGEWTITTDFEVTHEHSKGDVAWRGSAKSLVLTAWGRRETGLEIIGDPTISDHWRRLAL